MSKLDLSKFKKVASTADATILRHPAGHEIKIAHKAVKPEMQAQLAALPHFDEGGAPYSAVQGAKVSSGFLGKKVTAVKPSTQGVTQEQSDYANSLNQQRLAEDKAKRPAVQAAPAQEPPSEVGKTFPATESEGGEVQNYDDGGIASEPSPKPSTTDENQQIGQNLTHDPNTNPKAKALMELWKAKGGEIKSPFHQMKLANYSKNIPHLASGGDPASSSMPDANADPTADMPNVTPDASAAMDPNSINTRNIYNQAMAQRNAPSAAAMAKGVDPDTMAQIQTQTATQQFGPEGQEPVAGVDTAAANQAIIQNQIQNKQAEDTRAKSFADFQNNNKALMAMGLPPKPVPEELKPQAGADQGPAAPVNDNPPAPDEGAAALQQWQMQKQQDDTNNFMNAYKMTANEVAHISKVAMDSMIEPPTRADGTPNPKAGQWIEHESPTLGTIFANKSTPGKLGMIAGLILGGAGGGLTGQGNSALQMYQNQIDNDLRQQQINLGKKNSILSYNMQMLGHLPSAIALSKAQLMDAQLHQLTQMAAKYPNSPQIQQTMQSVAMQGMRSSQSLKDNAALGTAYMHAADHMGDVGKIQFNPVMTPEGKQAAMKEYADYQNLTSLRDNTLAAFDQVAKLNTLGNRLSSPIQSTAQIQKLRDITLDKLTKDTSGRVTPETVHLVGSVFKNLMDNKSTTAIGRQQLYRILSQNMHFPYLQQAGINTNPAPSPQQFQTGAPIGLPNLGR